MGEMREVRRRCIQRRGAAVSLAVARVGCDVGEAQAVGEGGRYVEG